MKNSKTENENQNLPKKVKSKSTSRPATEDELMALWLEEPIMQEQFALTEAIRRADGSDVEKAIMPTAFLRRIRLDLEQTPHCLPAVNEEWNKFCDRHGWPQAKRNAPGPEEPGRSEDNETGPF